MTQKPAPATPETAVPDGETPPARCEHCGRPFRTERLYHLHLRDVHDTAYSETERTAVEEALDAERADLFTYHMKVVVALGLLYSFTVIAYMVVLQSGAV